MKGLQLTGLPYSWNGCVLDLLKSRESAFVRKIKRPRVTLLRTLRLSKARVTTPSRRGGPLINVPKERNALSPRQNEAMLCSSPCVCGNGGDLTDHDTVHGALRFVNELRE